MNRVGVLSRDEEKIFFRTAAAVLACLLIQNGGEPYGPQYGGGLRAYRPIDWAHGEITCSVELMLILEEAKARAGMRS